MREARRRARSGWGLGLGASLAALVAVGVSCGNTSAPSPFAPEPTDGGEGGVSGDMPSLPNGGVTSPEDPELGGPCSEDDQCDDGIDCTHDSCDESVGRCRFTPEHRRCADDVYCDGDEVCVLGVGCTEGEPVTCSDDSTCTIDRCNEETRSCEHLARDADGDGDAIWNCFEGTDCDDSNPRVSGKAPEICGNRVDDDCDGEIDEKDCSSPLFDTCEDPLMLDGNGSYELSLEAASQDFTLSCAENVGSRRDVVAMLVVPEGEPLDVDVTARSQRGDIALAVFDSCEELDSESLCARGVGLGDRDAQEGSIARLIARGLPPGEHPIIVSGVTDDSVYLEVRYGNALPAPEHETCGTAATLEPGAPIEVSLAGAQYDVPSACGEPFADVVYRFTLDETQDVALNVAPLDARGQPFISLRDEGCERRASELSCRSGVAAQLFARALPPGTYFAVVGSTGPGDVSVRLDVFDPSEPLEGEGCDRPIPLELGRTQEIDFSTRTDAVQVECSTGVTDASFSLELEEPSDVLLVEHLVAGERGSVSLLGADCDSASSRVCTPGVDTPIRARAFGVPKGEYRVVAESQGGPATLTAFARPARPTAVVGLADYCDDAVRIDENGGRFVGNTTNARADLPASCDSGLVAGAGAADQVLLLSLSEPRRVVFDMQESSYTTLLVLREAAATCQGPEVSGACVPGFAVTRSFLDTTLPEGEYIVQIDGYNYASGEWVLDVYTADPAP